MSDNFHYIQGIRTESSRIAEHLARTREIVAAYKELLTEFRPGTFLGHKSSEPFPKEKKQGSPPADPSNEVTSGLGRHVLFKCPQTGMKVQHWLADDTSDENYKSVTCPACTGLHFVHSRTGELLGHREQPQQR